ncbi:MAG TPA: DUF2071 domain-containing protein, partial [Planctomycetota bacterium]
MRFLEVSLLFSFVVHGLAILGMALLLMPAMPGGGADDAARIRYLVEHPWLFRLGWFPWQVTALSDLLIAVGLLRAKAIPKLPAVLTLLVTVAAVIPDQVGQALWITRGLELAKGNPTSYLAWEAPVFQAIAVWAGTLYTVGAVGWTWCFAAAGIWNRALTIVSWIVWPLFFYANSGLASPAVIAIGNGVGFFLLQVWFALVIEALMRRSRPDTAHGRYAPWRHPTFRPFDLVANSRFVRGLTEALPGVAFDSDITNVIYVNYVVDAARLEPLVPPGLELHRVGDKAVFTFLTFRHGHFGPRLLGPLRKLLPSPIHTNWRIHVRGASKDGIYFVTNAIASTPHALAARMLSEGMPMHVLKAAELSETRLRLDPGRGSAPDVEAEFRPAAAPERGPWTSAFATWKDALA